jgi:hypothetical protein
MADNHDWNGGYRGRQEQKAERVTVIEAGLERTTHASGYGHGKKVKDGVLVSATGSPDGAKVVSARAIREPWDTFAKRRQELRDADSARRGEAAAAADAVTARLTAALPDGFAPERCRSWSRDAVCPRPGPGSSRSSSSPTCWKRRSSTGVPSSGRTPSRLTDRPVVARPSA